MTIEEMKKKLEEVLSLKRFKHSLGVMDTAVSLAKEYGVNEEKAAIAGLLHDCAREIKGQALFELCEKYHINVDYITLAQPELLHGPLGAVLAAKEYGVEDEDIIRAIDCHTTGKENMTLLDKIVFIADYIEPGRRFTRLDEVRELAYRDLDRSILTSLDNTIRHIMNRGVFIHPDTIGARNFIIKEKMP
ncbi:bis(5'-nucleosyl)-tetraphosphatase (symmetrical) YqeK [Acetivibrio mesophilus]|uniref:bis(5'-nucleosyl)-tetraphosphatase (symmetrical) n=1 Tax=Acetivibrio mesophilus TaxID=2487273 RepID=A0A4Q0I6J9_9FIRM|nr:bis(5'-nucleosyl)-tetraphosphatase (symmetrical) YqeK [Acetivibrio mesophilus]ODM24986.1 phosphohydrolase [Clostridium sp. Bc-iso-3]RXE60016.1 HD domain-containing protein [Acetivibrio mesophilus]HHV30020.1 HD domain-containing protein [Clostridium sp.]